ncbi:MAG: hypothetical protein FWD85_13250 [Microbacteriaceae bacterium]|nr:hypothetical protein [Microbacteriaceae bacterium]MCL2796255.1 hypothetical protein [Microbacteriaceae bacterium]
MRQVPRSGTGRWVVVLLGAAVVFLGIEAIEAVLNADALPPALRFAALHTVGVVTFGVLSVLSVIAAVLFSGRGLVMLVGVVLVAAAVALLFV